MNEKVTAKQIGELITQSEQGRITRKMLQKFLENPKGSFSNITVVIDRTKPFNPARFIGKGWSIAEQDERSLALTELDLAKVKLAAMLNDGDEYVDGKEKIRRLKSAGYIRLDAKVFQTLWNKPCLIPERWKGWFVYFDGTVLRHPLGDHYVLCLFWRGDKWNWKYHWLEDGRGLRYPSAVLGEYLVL